MADILRKINRFGSNFRKIKFSFILRKKKKRKYKDETKQLKL